MKNCRFTIWIARAVVLLAAYCSGTTAFAQIPISGVADTTIYTDQVTFTVTAEAGYTYDARLDGTPISVGGPVVVPPAGYHELSVWRTNAATLAVTNRLVRFIVRSSERAATEDGIPKWTPHPLIPSANGEFVGAALRILAPQTMPQGLRIPVAAWVEDETGRPFRVNGTVTAPGQESFRLFRGVGSGFLSASNAPGVFEYQPAVGGLVTNKSITVESGTVWTSVGGTLSGSINWPANARIAITNQLVLAGGATLTIGAGAIIRVNPGVSITNNATVLINGTWDAPVVFTPVSPAQPWGGFVMRTSQGSVVGSGVIFTGAGSVPNWFGTGGKPGSHRPEQALFFCGGTNRIMLTNAAVIALAGQLGHAVDGGTFVFEHFLMQQATSGGEYSGATLPLRFTVNNSAFIECPDDSSNFVDGDNDALYLVHGNHNFTNTLIGFVKDDGIDSGGAGAANLTYQDCWFESAFHEGNSLSGTGKNVNHLRTVFINCGQALEVGYDGPVGNLRGCLSTANLIGARFGDNYNWTYTGFLRVTNSLMLHNYRDVWGMTWNDWAYRTSQMDVRSNLLSAADSIWPSNQVWNPASDAARLTEFIAGPSDSVVGIGFALRTNRVNAAAFTNSFPIRLSRFSPQVVSADYVVETPAGVLASGSVVFQPGESVKLLSLAPGNPHGHELLSVRLVNPVQAEITGIPQVFAVGTNAVASPTALIPFGATWRYLDNGVDQGTNWLAAGFDDGAWSSGTAKLGYNGSGNSGLATVLSFGPDSADKYRTHYFRKSFTVASVAAFTNLFVETLRDDGVAVYLNGQDFYRNNLPAGALAYSQFATNAEDNGSIIQSAIRPLTGLVNGTNVLAAEVHQSSANSSDLLFDLQLTSNPAPAPAVLKLAVLTGQSVLYWDDPGDVLEEAPELAGPWTVVAGATNPQAVEHTGVQRFFRLRR